MNGSVCDFSKPVICAEMRYVPGCNDGALKSPAELLSVWKATLVAVLVTVTLTFGRTAPVLSVMVPRMVPVAPVWPKATLTATTLSATRAINPKRQIRLNDIRPPEIYDCGRGGLSSTFWRLIWCRCLTTEATCTSVSTATQKNCS